MSANRQFMDHRWGSRVKLELPAELITDGGLTVPAQVSNASISGAFIETEARLPLLSRVSIRPRAGAARLGAWVVRNGDDGMAIEWLEPGVDPLSTLLTANREAAASRLRRPDIAPRVSVMNH